MRRPLAGIQKPCYFFGLLLFAAACMDAGPPASYSVRDSAGVRIVESHRPDPYSDAGWTVSSEPILQLGARDGEETLQFFNVTGGVRLSDGRIAILNSGSKTVRIFGGDGGFVNEFGGSGDGPGEFRNLSSIHCLSGDTLLIWDGARPGISFFTSSGEFIRSQRLAPPGSESVAGIEPLSDGRLVVKTYASPLTQGGDRGVGIYRDSAPLFLFDRSGVLLDTIGVFPSTESALMEVAGHTLFGAAPFPKSTWIDVKGNSIYVGTANTMEVSVLNSEGMVEAVFRYPAAELAVRQEDRDWYGDRMTEMASSPQEEQMLGPLLEALVFPETRAAFSDLRLDGTGSIWLRTGRHFPPFAPSNEWTVLSDEGVLLGTLSLPERFEVLEFGSDYILGVWKDEMDVEFVRLYSLGGGAEN